MRIDKAISDLEAIKRSLKLSMQILDQAYHKEKVYSKEEYETSMKEKKDLLAQYEEAIVILKKANKKPEPLGYKRHILLYAKLHYKENDLMKDLRTIIASGIGLDFKSIREKEVWEIINGVWIDYVDEETKRTFINDRMFAWDGEPLNRLKVIRGLMQDIQAIPCKNDKLENVILDIGEADPKLLPLS